MNTAELIIKSNAIFTGVEKEPFKGAVVVSEGKIVDVIKGDLEQGTIATDTKILDCGDKTVMPGFIDAHMHFYMGACANSRYLNNEIEKSISEEDCVRMMKEYEAANPDLDRLLGWGWFPATWSDAPLPSKKSLDEAFPDKEVILYCADGHTAWLNSKGMEACGFNKDTKLEFGEVKVDENGETTGIVTEGGCLVAFTKMYDHPMDVMREIYKDIVNDLLKSGITMTSDMTMLKIDDNLFAILDKMLQLEEENLLKTKVNFYTALHEDNGYEEELKLKEEYCEGNFRYAGLKCLIDGVSSTYTALMLEPYSDKPDCLGDPANFSKEFFVNSISAANGKDLPVRLHAIGDRAVRWALDAFEESNRVNKNEANKRQIRNAIEHIETIDAEDISRFAELGVIPSMQPYHLTLDANEKLTRAGLDRSKLEWIHKTMLETNAMLAFGTDYPVVDFDPFKSIYAAVTRKDDDGRETGCNPEECVGIADAIKCYTYNAAYSYGLEKETGSLEKGKAADIVILDRNIFKASHDEIQDITVEYTYVNGELVYSA